MTVIEHPERLTVTGCQQRGPASERIDAYYCSQLCLHDAWEVEYVRADIHAGAVARIAELEAELEPYRKAAARERSADRQSDAY